MSALDPWPGGVFKPPMAREPPLGQLAEKVGRNPELETLLACRARSCEARTGPWADLQCFREPCMGMSSGL